MENTTKTSLVRNLNIQEIEKILKAKGKATKAEIAEATGLSLMSAGKIVNLMEDQGRLVVVGRLQTKGRGSDIYAINPESVHMIGVFAIHHHFHGCVIDAVGKVIREESYEMEGNLRDLNLYEKLTQIIDELIETDGVTKDSVGMLGIGLPGIIHNGTVQRVGRFAGFDGFSIATRLEQKYQTRVMVENDVNLMTMGYYRHLKLTEDKPADSLVLLHIGGGVGAGIMVGGKVIRGATNMAGEVAFLPLRCTEKHKDSLLPLEDTILEQIRARKTNPQDTVAREKLIEALAELLIGFIAVLNPEVVAINDVISTEEKELLDQRIVEKIGQGSSPRILLYHKAHECCRYGFVNSFMAE